MENLHNIKIRLKNDLPKEGINQVLKTLKGLIPESAPKYNSVIQIESAYKEVKLSIMDGILEETAIKKSNAEIRGRLLKLIDSLEAADFDKKTKKSTLAKNQEIRKGHVLYKIPQKMQLWQEARCLVRIAFEKAMLVEDLDIDENTQFRMNVRISDYMKVEVFDPAASPVFEIRTTSEPVQIIDQDDYTEWKFYIKPLQAGEHKLELKVTIMINIDGEIRVREKTLEESVVIVSEEIEAEELITFKRDAEAFVLPCAVDTLAPSASGFRLPKAIRPMAMALLFLMIGSTVTYAMQSPIQRDWIRTHYIDGKILGDAAAYDEFIQRHERKPAANQRYDSKSQTLVERATFEKAVVKETPEAFEEYIEKYPENGQYLEQATWQVATLSGEPEAYLDYKEKYPHKLERVQTAVKELKILEQKVWEEVQSNQDIESLGRYLHLYQDLDGQHIEVAKEKLKEDKIWASAVVDKPSDTIDKATNETTAIEKGLWTFVLSQNEKKGYENYLSKYGDDGTYADKAKDSLSTIAQREKLASEALKEARLWKGVVLKPSKAAYQNYIRQFPKGKYAEKARITIDSFKTVEQLQQTRQAEKALSDKRKEETVIATPTTQGTFIDSDDNQVYPYLKIGKQIWMTRNMNKDIADSFCYDNNPENCKKYGRLYTWEAAKKVCPKGWHLPKHEEWKVLLDNYGGEGSNSYQALIHGSDSNFAALLGGKRFGDGEFYYLGEFGDYWSASEKGADNAWFYIFSSFNGGVSRYNDYKELAFSCRCLKD